MKIKYRILNVDLNEHSIYVRYYTDIITEDSLATEFDENNNVRYKDGFPTRCRTDYHLNIWQIPSPSEEELKTLIMSSAPINWFMLQESIKNEEIDTSLSSAINLKHKEHEFETKALSNKLSDEEIDHLLEKIISRE